MSKPQSRTTSKVQSYSNRKGDRIMRHGIATTIAMAATGILALAGPSARAALIVEESFVIGEGSGEYTGSGASVDGHPPAAVHRHTAGAVPGTRGITLRWRTPGWSTLV